MASNMTKYTIYPIVVGTKIFDKGIMTYQHDYGTPYTIPIFSWYLAGGEKNILVDTGELYPVICKDREKAIGGKIYTFEKGLARHGLKPKDIDVVIHTHLHAAHCENDYKCCNAKFYIHEKELETINAAHPLDYRYVEEFISEIRDAGQIRTVTADQEELFPGITVMHTPAHTPGGMTVFIETERGKTAITGFCVIRENFSPPLRVRAMEMEVIPPGTSTNAYTAYNLMLKVRELADYIIPLHEPEFAAIESI